MRLARNLLLAAAAAIAAMAFMATSAFAQSVEVIDEATGAHCADVTELANHDIGGGCEVAAHSVVNPGTLAHTGTSEVVTSNCESEHIVNIDESGSGYIDVDETTIHTNPQAGCPIEECDEAAPSHAELEWPISGMFEYGGEQEEMVRSFCIRTVLDPEGAGSTCTIIVDVAQDHETHDIVFSAGNPDVTPVPEGAPCHENPATELFGRWQTTGLHDDIEIVHDHYPGDSMVAP